MTIVEDILADVRKSIDDGEWSCEYCEATRRANVYGPDQIRKKIEDSVVVVIKCRACKHEEIRYYASP